MKLPDINVYPKQGYRKWWLAAVSLILSATFVLLGLLTGSEWNISLGLILGVVGMSAVGGKVADSRKKGDS